jgi:hypothetical protein
MPNYSRAIRMHYSIKVPSCTEPFRSGWFSLPTFYTHIQALCEHRRHKDSLTHHGILYAQL